MQVRTYQTWVNKVGTARELVFNVDIGEDNERDHQLSPQQQQRTQNEPCEEDREGVGEVDRTGDEQAKGGEVEAPVQVGAAYWIYNKSTDERLLIRVLQSSKDTQPDARMKWKQEMHRAALAEEQSHPPQQEKI